MESSLEKGAGLKLTRMISTHLNHFQRPSSRKNVSIPGIPLHKKRPDHCVNTLRKDGYRHSI